MPGCPTGRFATGADRAKSNFRAGRSGDSAGERALFRYDEATERLVLTIVGCRRGWPNGRPDSRTDEGSLKALPNRQKLIFTIRPSPPTIHPACLLANETAQ
jgi:hypothetical protein